MSYKYTENAVKKASEVLKYEIPNGHYYLMEDSILISKETDDQQEAIDWFQKGEVIQVRTKDFDYFRFGPGRRVAGTNKRGVRITCNTLNVTFYYS